jgi:hypothetical protein
VGDARAGLEDDAGQALVGNDRGLDLGDESEAALHHLKPSIAQRQERVPIIVGKLGALKPEPTRKNAHEPAPAATSSPSGS